MYTLLANNEYEEDRLAKAEGYLHKLLQVVPGATEAERGVIWNVMRPKSPIFPT